MQFHIYALNKNLKQTKERDLSFSTYRLGIYINFISRESDRFAFAILLGQEGDFRERQGVYHSGRHPDNGCRSGNRMK